MLKEALFYEKNKDSTVRCGLCNHRCEIADGEFGLCRVRKNESGRLYTYAYGEAAASHVDPIEKKPLYHFFPGSKAYSIATAGCNFKCGFCQNWRISHAGVQALSGGGYKLEPEEVVRQAKLAGCESISYTYTEPTIFFEYALDTARIAKREGLKNSFVTNGYMTKEALEAVKPYLDACNVDLKSFSDDFYGKVCGARLQPVLESIKLIKSLGIWLEVTTLVVPGENDTKEELHAIAQFLAGIDRGIPWHISRFHPDYKYSAFEPTPINTLKEAEAEGKAAGLRYVYIGNVLDESEGTICYNCGKALIKRFGYKTDVIGLKGSKCRECGSEIDGVFSASKAIKRGDRNETG